MPFTAEQHSFFDPPPLFLDDGNAQRLPIDGLHVYNANDASMRIRLLSLFPVVTPGGPEMMRTETVTVLNDMCIMAPARLLDPAIRWRELDARSVEATYSNAGHVVHAVLVFNDEGALDNFWSDDRPALAEDGKTLIPQRWSTPVGDYRAMPPCRLASSRGEARYAAARGEYAYIEFRQHRGQRARQLTATARGGRSDQRHRCRTYDTQENLLNGVALDLRRMRVSAGAGWCDVLAQVDAVDRLPRCAPQSVWLPLR